MLADPFSDPQFFLQGTQLAQLSEEYDLVQTQIEVISNSLAQKETVLPEMKDVIKEAKKKVDDIAAVGKAEEKLLHLEHQLAWCYVCGKEEETKQKATEVEQSGDRLKQAKLFVKEGTVSPSSHLRPVGQRRLTLPRSGRLTEHPRGP